MKGKKFLLILLALLLTLVSACAASPDAGDDGTEKNHYIVTFYADHTGEDVLTRKRLADGSTIRLTPSRNADGTPLLGWTDADGQFIEPDGMTVTEDMAFYAYTIPALYTDSHTKYMGSIASVWFRPDTALRREEAAQILYSILAWPDREDGVLTESSEDETEDPIPTEPEPVIYSTNYEPRFSDLDETCPYYAAVKSITAYRLMSGYPDGTFRPDDPMTRAEFVAMLAPYGKTAVSDGTDFADISPDYWAADAIAAAKASGWLDGLGDKLFYPERTITRAEAVTIVNRVLGHKVDTRALDETAPMDMYIDVPSTHWAYYDVLDATYSSELLSYIRGEVKKVEPGFIHIDDVLYHVNEDLCLDYYEAGFHFIEDQLRYCSEDGYAIDQFYSGYQEIDGSMYYALSGGGFLTNGYIGYLYFGEDGKYTSGSDHLDQLVEAFLDGILHNEYLTQEEKLAVAYERAKTSFGYLNWGDAYSPGTDYWADDCAAIMFERKLGHCFYWSGAFTYAARRLGYQAYSVCGYTGTVRSLHAWTMIDWPDGNEYIFDPGLEWSYERGFIDNGFVQYRDLYMQPFYASETLYTFADGSHTTEHRK